MKKSIIAQERVSVRELNIGYAHELANRNAFTLLVILSVVENIKAKNANHFKGPQNN